MRFLLVAVTAVALLFGAWGALEAKKIKINQKLIEKAPLLHRLIANGDTDELARVLPTMSKYLSDTTDDGRTALHWCVYCDNPEGAKLLLESGADVNHKDGFGLTPMHEAAREGNTKISDLFIQNGGDLEVRDTKHDWTAFLWAVYSGNPELIKRFITEWQEGSQNLTDKRGNNAISVAAIAAAARASSKSSSDDNYSLTDTIRLLLDAGVNPDEGKALTYMPLDEVDAITLLLENNANPNTADNQGVTPLMRAAAAGNMQALKLFLKHKADINAENMRKMTALNLIDMTKPKHKEILKLLLSEDINMDTPSIGMLFSRLLKHKDNELLTLLLDKMQASGKNTLKKINPDTVDDQDTFDLLQRYDLLADDNASNSSQLNTSTTSADSRHASSSTRKRRAKKRPDFLRDLNAEAKDGKLPKLIGREDELNNVIRSLGRKVKNNPLLIGEAGVGKTAIAEGLVQLIVAGRVPEWLRNRNVYALDMNELMSGTQFHGALQSKVSDLIAFASEENAILFIDEIHMIVGAGSQGSQMNIANSLKQALARGEISCIGATTHREYQRYFARDQALERRFLPIRIDAPNISDTLAIVRGIKGDYEKYHNVEITDDSLAAVVEFANQYVTDRYFPDKALDVLDESLAHLKMAYDLAADSGTEMERVLTREVVADSLAKKVGVSKDKMLQTRQEDLINLVPWLQDRIFGQDQAIQEISNTMQLANSGLKSHIQEGDMLNSKNDSPTASFLFNGRTGVGKTEMAKLFSEYLYNGNLIRLNMTEFSEAHSVAKLIGAPPGYIGHDEGGQLVDAVRKQPHSVVLFDEVDKAHPAVNNFLLQILSEGQLTDSKGNDISFKNTVVILTSNSATSSGGGGGTKKRIGFDTNLDNTSTRKLNIKDINISPNVLDRLDSIIMFNPINAEAVDKLLSKELTDLNLNLQNKGVSVALSDAATDYLHKNALNPELGARSVRNAFADRISLVIAKKLIKNELEPGTYQIDFDGEKFFAVRDE